MGSDAADGGNKWRDGSGMDIIMETRGCREKRDLQGRRPPRVQATSADSVQASRSSIERSEMKVYRGKL